MSYIFIDKRNNKTYPVWKDPVTDSFWLAKNLDFPCPGSHYVEGHEGCYYNSGVVAPAIPPGWRLPTGPEIKVAGHHSPDGLEGLNIQKTGVLESDGVGVGLCNSNEIYFTVMPEKLELWRKALIFFLDRSYLTERHDYFYSNSIPDGFTENPGRRFAPVRCVTKDTSLLTRRDDS